MNVRANDAPFSVSLIDTLNRPKDTKFTFDLHSRLARRHGDGNRGSRSIPAHLGTTRLKGKLLWGDGQMCCDVEVVIKIQ